MTGIPPEVKVELEKVLADSTPAERCAHKAGYLMGLAFATDAHSADAEFSSANLAVLAELVKTLQDMDVAMREMN